MVEDGEHATDPAVSFDPFDEEYQLLTGVAKVRWYILEATKHVTASSRGLRALGIRERLDCKSYPVLSVVIERELKSAPPFTGVGNPEF